MSGFQEAKKVVMAYHKDLEGASPSDIPNIMKKHIADNYLMYAVYPFNKMEGINMVAEKLWQPLYKSFHAIQRRPDIFIAGDNAAGEGVWTLQMGNYMGIFAEPWLGIPANNRIVFLRYAEFNRVENGKITQSAFHGDIIFVMKQAGFEPLPMQTGDTFVFPGPVTHDGLLYEDADPSEGQKTLDLVQKMIDDLTVLNKTGNDRCPPEVLQKSWSDKMAWYGTAGIGAAYTIPLYQKRHQYPFREGLSGKVFNGHVARIAEGNFAGFFGWPNLNNTPKGGFLGLPSNELSLEMRVVDVYRRAGDKLAENWVFIDIPYWLKQQGLDILERCRKIANDE